MRRAYSLRWRNFSQFFYRKHGLGGCDLAQIDSARNVERSVGEERTFGGLLSARQFLPTGTG
jgi:hypothetical protein